MKRWLKRAYRHHAQSRELKRFQDLSFYRPVKQLVSIRVDADVLAWFRGRGKKYQTYMNEVLRREMQANAQGANRLREGAE